ncbi:MAG TPA: TetR/AcrR family transcriptional regulator [Thermomicrobiales bacterium]|nr:TetR/AcrR family transcriptional regulator [Thermomicrobiales bacterium]
MARRRDGQVTRDAIVVAAIRILARDGYQGLSARAIAAESGTNLARVNYYFGSKQNLLLEVFVALDDEKVGRQRRMYEEPNAPLSRKWRTAVAFYREDLADGYVRIMQELYAVGYGDARVGQRVRERMNTWRSLIAETMRASLPELSIDLAPEMVASALVSFWLGMESQHLAGASEDEGHFFAILDTVGDWLEALEHRAAGSADRGHLVTPAPD